MSDPQKLPSILYITDAQDYGGAEEYLLQLASAMQQTTHTTILHLGSAQPHLQTQLQQAGVAQLICPPGALGFWQLLMYRWQYRQSIWHLNLTHYGSCRAAQLAVRILPFGSAVATIHTLPNQSSSTNWLKSIKHAGARFIFSSLKNIIAPSIYIQQRLITQKKYPTKRTVVIYNGIAGIKPVSKPPISKPLTILHIGRMHPDKGQTYLLQAVATLTSDYRLIMVGDGLLTVELKQQAKRLGIDQRVEFAGFSNNIASYYAQADIFVLPSLANSENFPLTILEAMSAGLPVIATKVGGIAEQVDANQTGLLVDPGDVRQLSTAIQQLIDQPDVRLNMGQAGRQKYQQCFTLPIMVDQVRQLYAQLSQA